MYRNEEYLFDLAEQEGREIMEIEVLSGHCLAYEFTQDKYCPVDGFITGWSHTAVFELKYRSGYTSTQIDDMGGHIFEWKKFTGLTSYDTYEVPLYIVIYPDYIMMWDISTITEDRFQLERNKYRKATVVESEIIPKRVAYLKREECCKVIKRIPRNEQDS